LVNTTKIESKVLELGRFVMKSIDIEDQGSFGIGSGRNNLYGDDGHQKSLIVFHTCGHQKSWDISSMVLLKPKCPAVEKSSRN
jgi:hypothetical protein